MGLDTWDVGSAVWFLEVEVAGSAWQTSHSVKNWEQSNIFSAGMFLLLLNFCQESFIKAKLLFS